MEKVLPKSGLDPQKEADRIAKNIPLVKRHKQLWLDSQPYNTGEVIAQIPTKNQIKKFTFRDLFLIPRKRK